LYCTIADDATDIVDHVTELCQIQDELAILGSLVLDEDFLLLIISLLPKSWDNCMSAYLGVSSHALTISLHEFISLVLEEFRCRLEKNGDGSSAMYGWELCNVWTS
jgi:hypothetical protein